MVEEVRPAIVFVIALTLITGVAYPFAMTPLARFLFPFQAEGSLVERDGHVVGSALIGQAFAAERYFHGRPSATTKPDPDDPAKTVAAPYNAANSGGSNLGPTSKALSERIAADVDALRQENPPATIPPDLVTASASGLDPHISPQAALFQVPRIARTRNLPEDAVQRLVAEHTFGRLAGLLGEPRVNVLELNLALDHLPAR